MLSEKGNIIIIIIIFQEFCPSHIIYKIPSPNLFSSHLTKIQAALRSTTSGETQYIS
jgi:hypothetical protein